MTAMIKTGFPSYQVVNHYSRCVFVYLVVRKTHLDHGPCWTGLPIPDIDLCKCPQGHFSVPHCHSPVMNTICFGLSVWLQCDCFFIYLLPKYLLDELTVPNIKLRACFSPTSRDLLWTLYLTSPPPLTAHSCGGQYIWGLLLWSAVGSEADQCPFSSGVWQQQGRNTLCTSSHRAPTLFCFFIFSWSSSTW